MMIPASIRPDQSKSSIVMDDVSISAAVSNGRLPSLSFGKQAFVHGSKLRAQTRLPG